MDSLKEICEETLRKDIDNDTVLLCLGVAEQFSVSRLKVRTILKREYGRHFRIFTMNIIEVLYNSMSD